MIFHIKNTLYFPIARYFSYFAGIVLHQWKPRIIVITGSSGKTTLLHMIESQLGQLAKYSHHANSAFGIPFDILGLKRHTLSIMEWPKIFLLAPFRVFMRVPTQKIYIVEVDCDRPGEGKFLANLLNPNITLWVSSSRTHSMNFEKLVDKNNSLEDIIAGEFGYLVDFTKENLIINADSEAIVRQIGRSSAHISKINLTANDTFSVSKSGTLFNIDGENYKFNFLLPKETIYQIKMTKLLAEILGIRFDKKFVDFKLPEGRSNLFSGIRNTTIVDSTYNANLDSMKAILNLFDKMGAKTKWVVIGDMLEQGSNEESEHKLLAEEINKYSFEKIILMGPRVKKYTLPLLNIKKSHVFLKPDDVLRFLYANLVGGETILFKGARFLEGVIENLLLNKSDSKYLVRREAVWQKRREKFGL